MPVGQIAPFPRPAPERSHPFHRESPAALDYLKSVKEHVLPGYFWVVFSSLCLRRLSMLLNFVLMEPTTPKSKTSIVDSAIGTTSHTRQKPEQHTTAVTALDGKTEDAPTVNTSSDGDVFNEASIGSSDLSQLSEKRPINLTIRPLPADSEHRHPPQTPTRRTHASAQETVAIDNIATQATHTLASPSIGNKSNNTQTTHVVHQHIHEEFVEYITCGSEMFRDDFFIYLPLNVADKFSVKPKQCIATKKKEWNRCTNMVLKRPEQTKPIVSLLEKAIENANISAEALPLKKILAVLNQKLCKNHHSTVLGKLKILLPDIKECVEKAQEDGDTPQQQKCRVDLEALRFWSRELLGIQQPPKIEISWDVIGENDGISLQGKLLNRQIRLLQRAPTNEKYRLFESVYTSAQKLGFPNFIPYGSGKGKESDVAGQIRTLLLSSTKAKERGWIYAFTFEVPAYRGLFKIGYSKNPKDRVEKDWGSHWNRKARPIFQDKKEDPIEHVYLLERLIFAELERFRLVMSCCQNSRCKIKHNEWVATSEKHVIDVIKKWTGWMRTKPYVKERGLGETWTLKSMSDDEISVLCKPCSITTLGQTIKEQESSD